VPSPAPLADTKVLFRQTAVEIAVRVIRRGPQGRRAGPSVPRMPKPNPNGKTPQHVRALADRGVPPGRPDLGRVRTLVFREAPGPAEKSGRQRLSSHPGLWIPFRITPTSAQARDRRGSDLGRARAPAIRSATPTSGEQVHWPVHIAARGRRLSVWGLPRQRPSPRQGWPTISSRFSPMKISASPPIALKAAFGGGGRPAMKVARQKPSIDSLSCFARTREAVSAVPVW